MFRSSAKGVLFSIPVRLLRNVATVLGLTLIVACGGSGGGGCGTFAKIPNGYPVDKRIDNAVQVRITKGFFDFLEANGKALVDKFLPGGGEIPVPSSCGGDTEICCGRACKVKLDYQSLKFEPRPPSTTGLTLRAKLKTLTDMNIKTKVGFITIKCDLSLDTARKGKPDVGVTMAVAANVNAATKLTSLDFDDKSVDILDLDSDDLDIKGGALCWTANLLKGLLLGTLKDQLKRQLAQPLDTLACQKCNTRADCSSLANQGCSNNFCMRDGVCLQLLGTEGRIDLGSLLGAYSPAAKAAMLDLYVAAGNYATVEALPNGGMSLGMMGGTTSQTRAACVPSRPAPTGPAPAKSLAFSGGTAPNGKPYHVGAGISTLELDSAGYTLYDTGGLCLDVGTAQVAMLSSGLLSALIPSINDLTHDTDSAIRIVGRPQNPPKFVLGKGTFKTDDTGKRIIDDPLLHVVVQDMALDFYVYLDERYVRFMRQTVDLDLPIGLDVDAANQLVPYVGDLSQAVANVRVTDSALLKETPAQLGRILPSLLPMLAGAISGALSPIKLPDVMGIQLAPVQIVSTADGTGRLSHLGLFLGVKMAPSPLLPVVADGMSLSAEAVDVPAETFATLEALEVPSLLAMQVTAPVQKTPRATLRVSARHVQARELEWQYRIDGALWRPFDTQARLVLEEPELRLVGKHVVEVRARVAGQPGTLDVTPAQVEFVVSPVNAPANETTSGAPGQNTNGTSKGTENTAEGQAMGCSMGHTGASGAGMGLLGLAVLALFSRRRLARRGGAAALLLAGGLFGGCGDSSGNDPGDKPPVEVKKPKKEFAPTDEIGRYQSVAIGSGKVMLCAYDATFGDLAFADMATPSNQPTWTPVDGLPQGEPEQTDPEAYRGGYVEPGDDVGRFASLKLSPAGEPMVAYQDLTGDAVKLAVRTGDKWSFVKVTDPQEGKGVGAFAQLVVSENGVPTVAYRVGGAKKADGTVAAQMVVAVGQNANPQGPTDFVKTVVEETPVSCGGLCGSGEACVYVDPAKKDRDKTICKAVETTCTPSCKSTMACIAAKCEDAVGAGPADMPAGTGLYARLLQSGANRALLFYSKKAGALRMATGDDWKVTTLSGGDGKTDTGRHIGAQFGEDGTLHLAYSDVEGRLFYQTVNGTTVSPAEVVDDGVRTQPSPDVHAVGAGATLVLGANGPLIAYQDSTAGTLEVAQKSASWTHQTLGGEATQSRGYYPQVFQFSGKWWISDVVYDRNADVLASLRFTELTDITP